MIQQQILAPVASDEELSELKRQIDTARDERDYSRVERLIRKLDQLSKARQLRPLAVGDMF